MAKNKNKNKKELGFEGVANDMMEINIDIDEELKELENHFGGITTDDGGVDELIQELDKGSKKKAGKKLFEHLKSTVIDEITLKCVNGEIETKKELTKLFKSRLGELVHSEKSDELIKIYEKYKNSDDFEDTIDQLYKLVQSENKDELEVFLVTDLEKKKEEKKEENKSDKENKDELEVFLVTDLEKKKEEDKKKEEKKEENKSDKEYETPFGLKFRTIEDFGIKPIPFKRKRIERSKLPC